MMAKLSDEGQLQGLGWFDGEVKRLEKTQFRQSVHVPHMGWNDMLPIKHALFKGLVSPRFYFLHSYYFVPSYPAQALATTNYGGAFTSAVCKGHIYGVQFHPEKSHQWGVQLLKNFAEL